MKSLQRLLRWVLQAPLRSPVKTRRPRERNRAWSLSTPPGTNDKVNIGVQSLQVEGQTMTLQLVLTPEFTSISDSEAVSIYAATGSTRFNPKLIDRENLKEYSLISDTGQDWATNRATTKTTNHEPVIWWGFYAAPEDNNDAFELRVLDAMAEFTDVPVTR